MKGLIICFCLCSTLAYGQVSAKGQFDALSSGQRYVLGPGDQLVIRASGAEEIGEKPYRIEDDGTIRLPLLGQVHPAGQTAEEFEHFLTEGFKKYVRDPQVIVSVSQLRSQPVTFSGSFRNPGVYNLVGHHTITEMMAVAGGLETNAKRVVKIRRQVEEGSTGLKDERQEANGKFYVATIDLAAGPGETGKGDNFVLQPFDIVSATAGDPIIVSGEVAKVGPVFLGDLKAMSVVQAISLSGGLTREASKHIKIYRPLPDSSEKTEIQIDLEELLKGQQKDPMLFSNDVVYVPRANGRALAIRIAGIAGGLAASIFAGMAVAGH